MIRTTLIALAIALSAGCAAGAGDHPVLSMDHPANPKAKEAAYAPPQNHLGSNPSGPEAAPAALPVAAPSAPPVKVDSLSADSKKALEELLKKYEGIRALLAADKVEGISDLAAELEKVARESAGSAPEPLRVDLKSVESVSQKLAHAEHVGLEGSRKLFGDLSRAAIRISYAVPDLGTNRRVYKCLMWNKGYSKWIQSPTGASNPYFGKEMLDCGSASDWKE